MDGIDPRGEFLFKWIITFTILTSATLALRFWASWLIRRRFSLDDLFIILSYMNVIVEVGFFFWALRDGGLGKTGVELKPAQKVILAKLTFTSSLVWLLGNVFAKLSILSLYNRIFTVKNFQWKVYAVMGLTASYGIAFLGVFISHCRPVSAFWDPQPGSWCRDIASEEFSSTSFSLVIDLLIILLPMPVLWGLQMTITKRITLTTMFSIGLITIGVMSWRLAETSNSVHHPELDFYTPLPTLGLIVMLELWLGMIVACIPTLAPLLNLLLKPMIDTITSHLSSGSKPLKSKQEIETIGQKPSRKKYYNIGDTQDPLASTLEGANTTECVADAAGYRDVELDAIRVSREVQQTRV